MSFLQFELWKDCNHNCPICYNVDIPRVRDKKQSLQHVLDNIRGPNLYLESIGLIGGEFFDGQLQDPEVKSLFYSVMDTISGKIISCTTKRGLLATSLMYEDITELEQMCNRLHSLDVQRNFLLCTSWDIEYRFDVTSRKNWERNMTWLHRTYPGLRLHVQMVMTQAFIDAYMHDAISIRDFEKTWNCKVDFNTPYKPFVKYEDKEDMQKDFPLFFPRRSDYMQFLMKAYKLRDIDLSALQNISQHSSCLHYTIVGEELLLLLLDRHKRQHTCLRADGPCKTTCCGYIDSPKRMHEDIKLFLEHSV